jgi:hypothetical protein
LRLSRPQQRGSWAADPRKPSEVRPIIGKAPLALVRVNARGASLSVAGGCQSCRYQRGSRLPPPPPPP